MFRLCSLLIVLLTPNALLADVAGALRVIDGDTIAIGEYRVRLHGIDAPEMAQTCDTEQGVSWRCGAFAAQVLFDGFEGKIAQCQQMDMDRYGRIVLPSTSETKFSKNASAILRANPPMIRLPNWAILPPTLASTT